MQRRKFINHSATVIGLALSAGLISTKSLAQNPTWNKNAFETKNLQDTIKTLGGIYPAILSNDIHLTAPEIAENGNVVRVGIESKISGISQMALLVEKNPNVLSALFDVINGTEANFSTHIKMGQTSNVYAVAKIGDKFYYTVKEVKVTLGGCGG